MQYYKIKRRNAFTLLEIIVALSMVVLILSAVYGSYRAATSSISHCKPRTIVERQARLFLSRLTSELRCCYAGGLEQPDRGAVYNTPRKEFQNEISQQDSQNMFSSERISAGNIFLRFVTTSFASNPYQNMGGLAVVSYKLDYSGKVLLRNVRKYTGIADDNDKGYQWFPVLSNVKTISCEFLKDEKWQRDWDSKNINILPRAVRISLVLENDETGLLSFESCAYIMCGESETSEDTVEKINLASGF